MNVGQSGKRKVNPFEQDGYICITLEDLERNRDRLIDGEMVETDARPYQCVDDLERSMLAKPNPCDWFQNSCDWRLRYYIAKTLREKYPDLTRDCANERFRLNTSSPIVWKLRDAFLGASNEREIPVIETWAERDARQSSVREWLLTLAGKGHTLRDENELRSLPPDFLTSLIKVVEEDPDARTHLYPGEEMVTPPPYIGYFLYRFLVPKEEREASRGSHPIAYWSTSEAWNRPMIVRLWSREDRHLDNRQFSKFLMTSVEDFLSKANAMASATYGLNESLRKRLAKARRERGEFIRVLSGDSGDPYIEQIRQIIASGGEWDTAKEKKRNYNRSTTRWGNYGNPAEMSELITQRNNLVIRTIKANPKLRHKFETLQIRVNKMKPGGRSPNIGKKGELERYLGFCFDVAQGTLPMRSIIELVLEKCEVLRPVNLGGAENRQSKIGNYSLADAAALEMERSFRDPQEEEW